MLTNEQLAVLIKSGNADVLELWQQVRRFAYKQAIRWAAAVGVQSGVDLDDLLQSAFLALLDALDRWEPCGGYQFIGYYSNALKSAFTAACGVRTGREQMDPLRYAGPLDVPVLDGGEDGSTLAELIPDQKADAAFEDVAERDRVERLHDALETALAQLPADQEAAVRRRYYLNRSADNKALQAGLRTLRHPRISGRLKAFL